MTFSCKVDPQKLFRAFVQIPLLASRELRTALKSSLRVVQVDAKLHHEFVSHSHKLENSVQTKVTGTGMSGQVYLERSVAPYAAAVHEGSRPHEIRPLTRKALHWVSGEEEFFSSKGVHHPGYKGDPFLFKALERQASFIKARVFAAVDRVFRMAGLK